MNIIILSIIIATLIVAVINVASLNEIAKLLKRIREVENIIIQTTEKVENNCNTSLEIVKEELKHINKQCEEILKIQNDEKVNYKNVTTKDIIDEWINGTGGNQ